MTQNVWEVLDKERYDDQGIEEMEMLYEDICEAITILGQLRARRIYDAFNMSECEVFKIFDSILQNK